MLVGLVVVVAVVLLSMSGGRSTVTPEAVRDETPVVPAGPPRTAAIIVNPSKFDNPDQVRERIARVCERQGWTAPLWIETTAEDPGTGQARRALEQGVDLVCPLGGDGTVRAVASALVGTDTPLGLLPGGTGNLLARNLDLPVDSLEEALLIALTGRDRRIDVGVLKVASDAPPEDQVTPAVDDEEQPDAPQPHEGSEHYFLVMAGLGYDADVMNSMDEKLKASMGWLAYLLSGMQNAIGDSFAVHLDLDEAPTVTSHVRSLIIGNVGKLQLGVELVAKAKVDDGKLDMVLLAPDEALAGWASVVGQILTQTQDSAIADGAVVEHEFTSAKVVLDAPQELQLDGDPIGATCSVELGVRHQALTVRVG